jgi:GNAT superfamily N-acetyltransferase
VRISGGEAVRVRTNRFWRDQFQAYRLWILERGPGAPIQTPLRATPAGLELRFLDRHERRDWVCQRGGDADWPQFRAAIQHDHDIVLAVLDGRTLGWAWIGYERVFLPPLGRDIRLPDGLAYLYDAFVRPAERGRGVGHALVGARCQRIDARGATRCLSHVMTGNEPSLQALRAHGFQVVGRTLFLKALALKVWTREPLPAPHAA